MILSDQSIRAKLKTKEITIKPFSEEFIQPASYDLHLDGNILLFKKRCKLIDIKNPVEKLMKKIAIDETNGYIINPGNFILANIKEITGVDNKHVGRLEGKSSLARLGIIIHATAGFLDPGNELKLTLEIANLNSIPIKIYKGMKIAQIAFETLDKECKVPYGSKKLNSKYYRSKTVECSKMYKNFGKSI